MVSPGDFVKVSRDGQRMWWRVIEPSERSAIVELDNHPATEFDGWELPIKPSFAYGDREIIRYDEVIEYLARPTA